MNTILLTFINLVIIGGMSYTAYSHGNYVGRMEAEANSKALQAAGYTAPYAIDNPLPAVYFEGN